MSGSHYQPPPNNRIQFSLTDDLVTLLRGFLQWLTRDQRAHSARIVVPTRRSLATGAPLNMPTAILSDVASVCPIEFDNLGGAPVAAPTGGTSTVNNDNAAACAVVVEAQQDGSLALVFSPVQPPQIDAVCNISFTDVVDGKTITTPTVDFVITADAAVSNAHLNTAGMTTRPL
jgi:hypothetical protein